MTRSGLLLLLAATAASGVAADEVYLANGRRLTGQIVSRGDAGVVIEVGPGRLTLPASRILRVERGTSPLRAFNLRAAALAYRDVEGWLSLGIWARDHGLLTQARDAFERVVMMNPHDPIANAGLGRVRYDGRWMSRDDRQRARGLVRHRGRWVDPAERAAELRERAAEAEARRAEAVAEARVREAEARARAAEAEAAAAERALRGTGPYSPGILGPVVGGTVLVPGFRGGRFRPIDHRSAHPGPAIPQPVPPRPPAKKTSLR